jgi:DNA-binding NtrC family response regulator
MIVKNPLPRILVCDDDRSIHQGLRSALGKEYEIRSAFSSKEGVAILKNHSIDLTLLDLDLGESDHGLDAIPKLLEIQSDLRIIVFSGRTEFELVRKAMRLGAFDYIAKGSGVEELDHVFRKALEHRALKKKTTQSQRELNRSARQISLIGSSPAIQRIKKQIDRARSSRAPVLIHGETGTGKEVVARLLRKGSTDGNFEPFVAIDSSTIQSSVAESVLFGYERGAFTGAEKSNPGLFEEADGGTLYFDELGNMPLEIQNKLLRAIQEKEVLRIGSSKPMQLDFRVIAATNRDLEKMISEGAFKDDLYQRLNVLQIHLPPLRDRPEDLPELLEHFSRSHAEGATPLRFLPETLRLIARYPFPGNVRELSNLVLYLYTMCESSEVSPLDLPPKYRLDPASSRGERPRVRVSAGPEDPDPLLEPDFYRAVELFERNYLRHHYERLRSNVSRMAQELGMDRSYLHNKLKSYGIHQAKGK